MRLINSIKGFFQNIKRYSFLMEQLISRDFKTKYKRSVLGIFWSFLNPLMMMAVQYAVFSKLMRFDIENYAVYLLAGIVLFSNFTECCNQSMRAIVGNASLITKVYVPKYVYPISKVFSASINLVLSIIPLILVAKLTGLFPSYHMIMLPIGLIYLIVFTVGMGFFLSSLMVFFRDIEFLWGVISTMWMYATPIIYDISILPNWLQVAEKFNPLYHYIRYIRIIVIEQRFPSLAQNLYCIGFALIMLLFGVFVFRKTEDKFILYI